MYVIVVGLHLCIATHIDEKGDVVPQHQYKLIMRPDELLLTNAIGDGLVKDHWLTIHNQR